MVKLWYNALPSLETYKLFICEDTHYVINAFAENVLQSATTWSVFYTDFLIKVKVKVTLVLALRLCTGRTAHMGSRGIALLFKDRGTRRGWGVSVTPRPLFTPGKDPVHVQEAGWAPGSVWTGEENLVPPGFDRRTVQAVASHYIDWATGPTFLNKRFLLLSVYIYCRLIKLPETQLIVVFQFRGSVHHTMITENTSLMQQDKYIFHLYVFSTCFGRGITHHQELQNCTHSDMVMVPCKGDMFT